MGAIRSLKFLAVNDYNQASSVEGKAGEATVV
jgi:hypothetical protein